jgi:hypothetical protein
MIIKALQTNIYLFMLLHQQKLILKIKVQQMILSNQTNLNRFRVLQQYLCLSCQYIIQKNSRQAQFRQYIKTIFKERIIM